MTSVITPSQPSETFLDFYTIDERIIDPANLFVAGLPTRKQRFDIPSSALPTDIVELTEIVQDLAEQPFNTIVAKRYNPGDNYRSAAYDWHLDPDYYKGKIAIVSLSGRANLDIRRADREISSFCYSGRLILLNSQTEHRVRPIADGSVRRILFFGFDATRAA